MSEGGDSTQAPTPHVADSEGMEQEDFYGSESEEVVLKTPQVPITRKDLWELIDMWEGKFKKITEGVRALEIGTHDVHTHMDVVMRDNRARENAQVTTNKQMKSIQEALAHYMDTYDPARRTPVSTAVKSCAPTMDAPIRTSAQPRAPTMSTPITPPGTPQNFHSEFSLSPVIQATPAETMRVDRGRDLNERPTHAMESEVTPN